MLELASDTLKGKRSCVRLNGSKTLSTNINKLLGVFLRVQPGSSAGWSSVETDIVPLIHPSVILHRKMKCLLAGEEPWMARRLASRCHHASSWRLNRNPMISRSSDVREQAHLSRAVETRLASRILLPLGVKRKRPNKTELERVCERKGEKSKGPSTYLHNCTAIP